MTTDSDKGFESVLLGTPDGPDEGCDETIQDIYYNGGVCTADSEPHTAWDPSLFKRKSDCIAYLKFHYGDCFENAVYWVETVRVGNGWDVLAREEFRAEEV